MYFCSCGVKLEVSFMMRWVSRGISQVAKGIKPPFELRGGTQDCPRVTAGESGLISSWGGAQCSFDLWQETRVSSRIVMGIWGFLSRGKRGVRIPLELRLGSRVSSRVAAWESGLLSNCRRNSGFFSSCSWKLGVP